MFNEYPPLLSVNNVAEILGVESHAVYTLISTHQIEAKRIDEKTWRIERKSLAKYVLSESGINVEDGDEDEFF